LPLLRLLVAAPPPQNVADALLDGDTLDAVPAAQRPDVRAMIAEYERLDHTLTDRGWQFCGFDSGPEALTWHYLPSEHDTISEVIAATTTITVVIRTAARLSGSDVELLPAGCAWIDGCRSTTVTTPLANLDQVEGHRAGDDPSILPFRTLTQRAYA
jgi:hypothetical protein